MVWLIHWFSVVPTFHEGDNIGRGAQQQTRSESPSSQVAPKLSSCSALGKLIHCEPPFPICKITPTVHDYKK